MRDGIFFRDMTRVRRAILPQATELNEIFQEILKKFKSVTTELDGRLEPGCFDRWMDVFPHEKVNDLEAKKKERHKNVMKRKGERKRSMPSSAPVDVELRHLLPSTTPTPSQRIYQVQCMTEDTLDMVLLQWMMKAATPSLPKDPDFYEIRGTEGISSICTPLAFSKTLWIAEGRYYMIIHCLMDSCDHPLIIFKQIPEWTFGKLCRFRHGLKDIVCTWYQEQLSNPDASINIKKTKSINERARREHSLTWVNMLDEIEEDPTESIWVIETPPKELLNEGCLTDLGFMMLSSAHTPSFEHIDKTADTASNNYVAQRQSTDTVNSSLSAQEASRANTTRRIADAAETESRSASSHSSNRMPTLARQSTYHAAPHGMDVHQPPKSSSVVRPSPKPEARPTPLPVAAGNPMPTQKQKPAKKSWFTRAKEFVGLG
ncbi:hypothetical protein CPB85DRAFT_1274116 [Mucidula mucida]|nr:hypothetical protein CPB85DRAFT_1274116 [Mucidula mucida]